MASYAPIQTSLQFLKAETDVTAIQNCQQTMTQPKQQLQASLTKIDKHITSTLQSRLSTIQANDTSLTKQAKSLQSRTHEARKQEDHWNNVVRAGRNGMKVPSKIV